MELTLASFQPLVGREFLARIEGTPHTSKLVLVHVTVDRVRDTTRKGVRREPFRLYFQGPEQTHVARQCVTLSCDGDSVSTPLYFEPMSVIEGVVEYEVIIG